MRISDWSSDVCSSDLIIFCETIEHVAPLAHALKFIGKDTPIIGMIGLYDDRSDDFYLKQLEGYLMSDHVLDRKRVVGGKSVSVRVDLGGRRLLKKKRLTT